MYKITYGRVEMILHAIKIKLKQLDNRFLKHSRLFKLFSFSLRIGNCDYIIRFFYLMRGVRISSCDWARFSKTFNVEFVKVTDHIVNPVYFLVLENSMSS